MTTARETTAPPIPLSSAPEQAPAPAAQPPDETEQFVPPWQECLDDFTLPPGGGGHKASAIATPCDPRYLTSQGRDLRLDLLRG